MQTRYVHASGIRGIPACLQRPICWSRAALPQAWGPSWHAVAPTCRACRNRYNSCCRSASNGQGDATPADPGASSTSSGGSSSSSAPGVSEYSEADLRQLTQQEEQAYEDELGNAWRSTFAGDVDGLFDYVERGHAQTALMEEAVRAIPESLRDRLNAYYPLTKMPAGVASERIGMGTWRVKDDVNEVLVFLVGRLEGSLRELLENDLALYPPAKWKAKGWDFMDSMDPNKEWDGFAYVDVPDPDKGEPGYPRLLVENRIYSSRVFRKLHLEAAWRQDGLEVLHVVFYPRYDFDIPILAMDLVLAGGQVTLAIIDACPLSPNLTLPGHYMSTMKELQEAFLPESLQERNVPDWGKKIFSPLCVCIRPTAPEELAGFMKYAVALTRAHLMYSALLTPLEPKDKASVSRMKALLAGHQRFCEQQLSNKKTARVLEVAFDEESTQQYMTQLMFDFDPKDSPPWFDGGLAQLYTYFEDNPEPWRDGPALLATQAKLDLKKAQDNLRRLMAGDAGVLGPRLAFTMEVMYEQDEDFRQAVLKNMPEVEEADAQGRVGEFLAEKFAEQVVATAGGTQQQDQEVPKAAEQKKAEPAAQK